MQEELIMIFDKGHWQDIYCRDGTSDRSITTEDDAYSYVRNVYGTRFRGCKFLIKNIELYALVPDDTFNNLSSINNEG